MGSKSLVGMEVPIIGSDAIKWVEVSVPSTQPLATATSALPPPQLAPPTEDAASCTVIGDPPTYFVWRIHKDQPYALEILEICGYKEFPETGLRIIFPDALCSFALICKDEVNCASGKPHMLYTLTVAGVAYAIRLQSIYKYATYSVLPPNDIMEFSIRSYPHHGAITAVAAAAGCLVIGKNDGSVSCFQLGMLEPSSPGFAYELRDDAGFGRLWGLMSRRTVGAVQDLVVAEVYGKKIIFVLHFDGTLRVWDYLSRSRIFSNTIGIPTLTDAVSSRLWVGELNNGTGVIHLAILYKHSPEVSMEMICVYSLRYNLGDKNILLLDSSVQNIPLEEGALVDVKLTSNKIWMLKVDGLAMLSLFETPNNVGVAHCYSLQEAVVAEQLFQSSEYSTEDLLWLSQSFFPSVKDQVVPFVSSIFLRRLLAPGIYHGAALRGTFKDCNKHITDLEFQSFTAERLKREILSIVEHEVVSGNPLSILYCWKTFCTRYFHNWCKINAPFGFHIDSSSGAVVLIRKTSVSLLRSLEDIEFLVYGSVDELGDLASSGLDLCVDNLDREILFEVLRCVSNISQQLGKASSAIFYESLLSNPSISSEDVVPRLLKILETGYNASIASFHMSEMGADVAWEKEMVDHRNLRKFSVEMLLSLHALSNKATTWGKVLDVIESYLKFLVPRKIPHKFDSVVGFNINSSVMVQATTQVTKVMFESSMDILLLLSYLVNISGQIHILHDDISRIQLDLVPMIQEIITEWHIIHFLGTTSSESPSAEDFSSQLSSLQIDNNIDKRSWNLNLGKCEFTLACMLLLHFRSSSEVEGNLFVKCLPGPESFISSVRRFASWILCGMTEESPAFFSHSTELALVLLNHGQYDAVEYLLTSVEEHSRKEKISESIQNDDGKWGTLLHLLGCCLLAQAQRMPQGVPKEKRVCEAVRCFFRASSARGASQALQGLSYKVGLAHLGFSGCLSAAAWKLHYYQWAMQIFEQYKLSESACQFALAALEQVDEALGPKDDSPGADTLKESATAVKGCLWANVFTFMLALNLYYDAYCAIISNPDEESKYICLRRFIIVLYERGSVKILCDGQIPFIGLADKVEQELVWKAGRSDVSAKPNPFKLLYAFEMHRHNWRRAATYIYLYSVQLKTEAAFRDQQRRSLILQERLNGLSATINALHLVHPAYAWIDPILEESSLQKEQYSSKKARLTVHDQSVGYDVHAQRLQSHIDLEKLENEFVLTSAEYLLSLANVKWTFTGNEKPTSELVELLVQADLYDMAFTVILKFWKGTALKRELERVFSAISMKCCPNRVGPPFVGNNVTSHTLLLTSSKDEASLDVYPPLYQSKGSTHWETLELYLEKYKGFHPRLPVIVAETLLCADPRIELPLWLVQMFKNVKRGSTLGMAGSEANPASLFQLYVDYGRFVEATNLLIEYMESFSSMRPTDIIRRKKPSAVWFPYTTIERLWRQLEDLISRGHMVDQCEKLKMLLQGALLNHLNLLRVDSDDVKSSAVSQLDG
ncbi:hypothetical protein NMG60_11032316 [Bertholletia excelsa]